jgi:hypothetical protein
VKLNIYDLTSGTEIEISIDVEIDLSSGYILPWGLYWSPDGTQLVFSVGQCGEFKEKIMLVDISTKQSRALLQDNPRGLHTVGWPKPDQILLEDPEQKPWLFSPNTGEMTEYP